jgi:hypothetical protein
MRSLPEAWQDPASGTYDMGFRDYDPGPQRPARQAVERDEQAIAWLRW